jgi:hypothetical protein
VTARYLPVWVAEGRFRSVWSGRRSESRPIGLARRGTKPSSAKGRAKGALQAWLPDQQESSVLTETVWHPQSGQHTFAMPLVLPASDEYRFEFAFLQQGIREHKRENGVPPEEADMPCGTVSLTEAEVWERNACEEAGEQQGRKECADRVDVLDDVKTALDRVSFTLLFVPFTLVSYTVGTREYRHVVDLADGTMAGDAPALDHAKVDGEAIAAEARKARDAQKERDKQKARKREAAAKTQTRLPSILWLALIVAFAILLYVSWERDATTLWWAVALTTILWFAGALVASVLAEEKMKRMVSEERDLPDGEPWETFLADHRSRLAQLLRVRYDQRVAASPLQPDELREYVAKMQALQAFERGESETSLPDVRNFALSLCGEAPGPLASLGRPGAAGEQPPDARR